MNHEILKELLSSQTCKCVSAPSARKGLAMLARAAEKNIPIDLIIVDHQMPTMTGEDFIRTVRTQDTTKHIPIVLYSSVDDDSVKQRLNSFGVEGYLTKPARFHELLYTTSKAMSGSAIPAKDAQGGATPTSTQSKPPQQTDDQAGHIDILIAEDNEVNQTFIRHIMKDMGLSFKIVPSGRLAVDKWKLLRPKIILMDISMPDWGGYEATKVIRELEAELGRDRTPIVAVTAHALKGDKQTCLDNDMDDYLSKPIVISKIEDMIEKWTDINGLKKVSLSG